MKTLGRNLDNDLYLDANGFAVVSEMDTQRAIIEALLLTQKGELQFDDEGGIDYFGTVLQSPRYIEPWATEVQAKVNNLPFVSSVDDFQYRFDGKSSTLYWSMVVVNTDGNIITMKDRQMKLDGSPGIDVKWDDIYNKPMNTDTAIDMVQRMAEAAAEQIYGKTPPYGNTLRQIKELIKI